MGKKQQQQPVRGRPVVARWISALPNSATNPYRAGSKKATAFKAFAQGGRRDEVLARMLKSGAKPASVLNWFYTFREATRSHT